jgi:predicted enzyme related to lactoylglutathione lyase
MQTPDKEHRSRLGTIVIDCCTQDLDGAARFWSAALGWPLDALDDPADDNYRELHSPAGQVKVLVQAVDHPSRVHIDIETDDIEAEVQRLEALGAKRLREVKRWWVLEAPTGQRFCVVRPQRADFEQQANVWSAPAPPAKPA